MEIFCLVKKDKFVLKYQEGKERHGTNFECKKKVIEGLWKRNSGKGVLCMVKLAKIEMNLSK